MRRFTCEHAICLEFILQIVVDSSDEESEYSSDYYSRLDFDFIYANISSDNDSNESFIFKPNDSNSKSNGMIKNTEENNKTEEESIKVVTVPVIAPEVILISDGNTESDDDYIKFLFVKRANGSIETI